MHFRHHSTSENTEAFVQDPVGEDITPVDASQARVISQEASHLHRKLSEKIHEKLKAHTENRLVLSPEWEKECAEVARKHMEKHEHHLHHEASLTSILAGSAAAAGYNGAAVHENAFPIVRDDQHGYTAPGYNAPAYTQDQYPPQASAPQPHRSAARIGRQESGIAINYDDHYEPQIPAPRSTARELADESLDFISRPLANNGNFPQATQRNQSTPLQQPQHVRPASSYPNPNPNHDSLPAQLQIRPKASTPPYPSQPNTSAQPCTAEVTVKSTPQIIDIIRQLQIEGFFHPSNVAFLPSQLEMRLRQQGLIGAMGGAANGAGVQVPGCMPDVRGFGGQGEEGGERDLDEGYESRENAAAGEHDYEHEEASEDEEHGEGEEAGDSGEEEHGEESDSEHEEGEEDDHEAEDSEREDGEGEYEDEGEEGEE